MTNNEMKREINKTASLLKKEGVKVDVNYSIPYVGIDGGDLSYFFQGEEAANILEEAIEAGNKFNTRVENTILWMSSGW